MLTVELQSSPKGERGYRAVASVTVFTDGGVKIDDPENLVPIDVPVLLRDVGGDVRQVTLESDPALWVRNLGRVLRTGYLVPVITVDDEN